MMQKQSTSTRRGNAPFVPTKKDIDDIAAHYLDLVLSEHVNDIDSVMDFIKNAASGKQALNDLIRFKHMPVGVREFVESPEFMDSPNILWPEVMRALEEINSGNYTECVLTGAIGVAKCLGKGTPVLMFDGTVKAVEAVAVGDLIMGPDSQPRTVKSLAQGQEEMFTVHQLGGDDYIVNRSHILSLQYTDTSNVKPCGKVLKRYGASKGAIVNLSVNDYLSLSLTHRNLLKGWKPPLVEFGGETVYDPYLIGLWLGDGTSANTAFTTMDPEIVTYLQGVAKRERMSLVSMPDKRGNKAERWTLRGYSHQPGSNPFLERLRSMNLLNNKHVPQSYLVAPLSDRLLLLAGLMDTDGSLTKTGTFVISQRRKNLADAIAFLARSCGFRVSVKAETINGCVYYRSFISGDTDKIPTLIPRKQAKPRKQIKEINRWGISVESIGVGDYYGFELEGPDRLFLLGDFTVTHNTTLALYTQAYQVYFLSCLRDPHGEMDLDPSSEILLVLQSLNKNLANDVDFQRLRAMIAKSPYFKHVFKFDRSILSELRFPNRIIIKPVVGHDKAAIGQNVIGGIIDEVNYMAVIEKSKSASDGGVYDQAMQNYNSIARRRESRFMKKGWMPGMLCLVSSRKYPGQFTDIKEEEAKTNKRIYVYDKRLWEVNPNRFLGTWFKVFVGDLTHKPRIIEENEQPSLQEMNLVMDIPTEYRASFEGDMLSALRDIAGVSTLAIHPYMLNREAVMGTFGHGKSILSRDDCDFKTSYVEIYPKRFNKPEEPRFVHLDLAVSNDSAGVSMGYVTGFTNVNRGDHVEILPNVVFDFILEVKPPKNGEISFEKIRELLYLCRKAGLNVKWVTADTYQSKDTLQLMAMEGFFTGEQSMDGTSMPYDVAKQAIYDGRVRAPQNTKAMREFVSLEIDPKTGKVDHPPNGSKDLSDSMAGVIYGLSTQREVWVRHQVSLLRRPERLTRADDSGKRHGSYVEQLKEDRYGR